MHKRLIIKVSALVTALVALNVSLGLFGYGMALPNWAMYVSLAASIIVLLAFAIGIVMHGGSACSMCCYDNHDHKNCGSNCHCK